MSQERGSVGTGTEPGSTERRRYNRRSAPTEANPPYFEIFLRIAVALEGIQDALSPGGAPPERRMPSPRAE